MADLDLVQDLALVALEDNKTDLPDWTFKWNNRTAWLGLCDIGKKTIYLSKLWVVKLTEDEALDVILHEVAHALAWVRWGSHKHDAKWRLMCLELGAKPNRLARVSISRSDLDTNAKWTVQCYGCNKKTPWTRKPKYPITKYKCTLCGSFKMTLTQNR